MLEAIRIIISYSKSLICGSIMGDSRANDGCLFLMMSELLLHKNIRLEFSIGIIKTSKQMSPSLAPLARLRVVPMKSAAIVLF